MTDWWFHSQQHCILSALSWHLCSFIHWKTPQLEDIYEWLMGHNNCIQSYTVCPIKWGNIHLLGPCHTFWFQCGSGSSSIWKSFLNAKKGPSIVQCELIFFGRGNTEPSFMTGKEVLASHNFLHQQQVTHHCIICHSHNRAPSLC